MAHKNQVLSPEELKRETRQLASDLAFCARAPVSIQLVGGDHIAYTYNADDSGKQHTIPIVMNPSILSKVRNKERALRIWRGIGFHELAHHLWPASAQYKVAHKEGFRDLFNLIDDEQNERRGRAFDASWGACFQSVCSYIFPTRDRNDETLSTGIADGDGKPRKPRGVATVKTYIRRWNAFAYHLRRQIPDPVDPVVAHALAMIEKGFKDLDKDELLALTRAVHNVLASDINADDLARAAEAAKAGKDGKPGEEPDDDDEDQEQDGQKEPEPEPPPQKPEDDEPLPASPGWNVRHLLRSKWLWLVFGGFIAGWAGLLLRGDIATWVRITIEVVLGLGLFTAVLFLRRAYIKSLLKRLKEAVSAGTAAVDTDKAKGVGKMTLVALVLAILGWLAWLFVPKFGPQILALVGGALLIIASWAMAKFAKAKADKKNEEISKPVMAAFVLAALVSVGCVAYGCYTFGLSKLLAGSISAAVSVFLIGIILFLRSKPESNEYRRKSIWQRIKQSLSKVWDACVDRLEKIWGAIWGWISRQARRIWSFSKYVVTRAWWRAHPYVMRLWRNTFFRLAVLALPIALVLVMLYAVLVSAGRQSWWLLLLLLLLLAVLGVLGFIFRKKIKKFVVNELFMPMPNLMDYSMQVPLDMETDWFVQVDNVVPVDADQQFLDEHMPLVHALAQQLRPYLERCGRQVVDREDQPDGFDLIDEAELALAGETSIFVNDDSVPRASVYLGVGLDCSTSMLSATTSLKPGEKFLLGKFFALVLEQACVNLQGVESHFWGFNHQTIFDCGGAGEGRISGLKCEGGNNDSAMLWHMGKAAAASGKDIKILVMLSDGQPSECSWLSLRNLVLQFEQEGMIPWNFALDEIRIPAFERFFTDLVGQSKEEAIVTMGTTLAAIAEEGSL